MQAEALVQLLSLVVVAPLAAHAVTGRDFLGGSVVARRDYSILVVYYYSPDGRFHAIGPASCNICDLHKILVPGGPEVSYHFFLPLLELFPQLCLASSIEHPRADEFQAILPLLLVIGLVQRHQLSNRFHILLPAGMFQEVFEALLKAGIHQYDIQVISFL